MAERAGSFQVSQVDGDGPTRVSLVVSGEPAGADITVERSLNRADWAPVRGAVNLTMPAGVLEALDFTVPLGRMVFYRLIVNGTPVEYGQVVTDSRGVSWIQDALAPHIGVAVSVAVLDAVTDVYGPDAFRRASWPQAVREALVMGAALPVESVGTRSRAGNVPIEIHAVIPVGDERLRELLLQSGPLLIRGAPCDMATGLASVGLFSEAQYVVIPDVVETHLGNPHEVATFTGVARYTQEPRSAVLESAWTWGHVEARIQGRHPGGSWNQVGGATGRLTFGEVHGNPALCGGQ